MGKRRKRAPPARPETRPTPAPGPRWLPIAVAIGAFTILRPRLCPTVCLIGDSGVFTSAAVVWGVPQPPGYPLFSFVGHLFTLLPFGDVAWRVNLTSAVFHAATVGVLARAIQRVTGSAVAAVGGALFLAFSGLFFVGSLYAEAFPLNDLFTALAIAGGLRVASAAEGAARTGAARVRRRGRSGLGAPPDDRARDARAGRARRPSSDGRGAHRVAEDRDPREPLRRGDGRRIRAPALAAMRDPWVNWGDVHDAAALFRMITRADYGGMLSPALQGSEQSATDHAVVFLWDAWRAFGPIGWGLLVLGILSGWRRSRNVTLCVLLGFTVSGPVFAMANAIPIQDDASLAFAARFATMSHVFLGVAVGMAIASVEAAVAPRWRRLAPLLGLAFVVPRVTHASSADLRHDRLVARTPRTSSATCRRGPSCSARATRSTTRRATRAPSSASAKAGPCCLRAAPHAMADRAVRGATHRSSSARTTRAGLDPATSSRTTPTDRS